MLATKTLDNAAQSQQIDNAVKSVSLKNDGTTLVQKNKGGSDFKEILAPKMEEKAKSTLESLCVSIKEFLDYKNSDKLKRGEAAKMVEALLKMLRNKKAAAGEVLSAGEMLSAGDRTNLLNLFKTLEEFIKKGLKQGSPGEKDNFKQLKELRQEIFSLISANGSAKAASAAVERSEEIGVSLPSTVDSDLKSEKPFSFTLVDLRRDRGGKQPAAVDPTSYTGQKKEGASHEFIPESSRESMPAELKAESSQVLVRTLRFESGELKGGIEAGSTSSTVFRRLFTPEIVQQSRIILQDGGKGEIRLILKPESLGRVRIRINIQDNSIEGRILVENNSVRELFEGNLEHLKNALRSEGFGAAALEVAVGGEKSGRDPTKEEFPSMRREAALEEFDRSMLHFGEQDLLIDLVV